MAKPSLADSAQGIFPYNAHMGCMKYLKMIIMHSLPFLLSSYNGFLDFCKLLNPNATVPSDSTVMWNIWTMFQAGKDIILDFLKVSCLWFVSIPIPSH